MEEGSFEKKEHAAPCLFLLEEGGETEGEITLFYRRSSEVAILRSWPSLQCANARKERIPRRVDIGGNKTGRFASKIVDDNRFITRMRQSRFYALIA